MGGGTLQIKGDNNRNDFDQKIDVGGGTLQIKGDNN